LNIFVAKINAESMPYLSLPKSSGETAKAWAAAGCSLALSKRHTRRD